MRSSRTACIAAVNGSGCATWPCASIPSARSTRQHLPQPPLRLGMRALLRVALRRDDQEARPPAAARLLADALEQRLAEHRLVRDDEDVLRADPRGDVGDDVLDRERPGRLADLLEQVAPPPAGRRLGMGRDDQLVRLLDRDRVLHSRERVVVDDMAGGRDPGLAKARQRPVEPPAGRSTTGVVVDDVPLARRVHRRDHDDERRPSRRPSRAPRRAARRRSASRLRRRGSCAGALIARSPLRAPFGQLDVGAAVQHRMPRARDAVLVRAADDLRDLVEVEDRRRRADLPLERQRAPRDSTRAGSPRVQLTITL